MLDSVLNSACWFKNEYFRILNKCHHEIKVTEGSFKSREKESNQVTYEKWIKMANAVPQMTPRPTKIASPHLKGKRRNLDLYAYDTKMSLFHSYLSY